MRFSYCLMDFVVVLKCWVVVLRLLDFVGFGGEICSVCFSHVFEFDFVGELC